MVRVRGVGRDTHNISNTPYVVWYVEVPVAMGTHALRLSRLVVGRGRNRVTSMGFMEGHTVIVPRRLLAVGSVAVPL